MRGKVRRLLLATTIVAAGLLGMGVSASPAGAQSCTWVQDAWVLTYYGSVQVLHDSCAVNHIGAIAYPNGGGAGTWVVLDWIPLECYDGGISIVGGTLYSAPAEIRFQGNIGQTFCSLPWQMAPGFYGFSPYDQGHWQAFVGSCNGFNVRYEGSFWALGQGNHVYTGGTKASSGYCSPTPNLVHYIYG